MKLTTAFKKIKAFISKTFYGILGFFGLIDNDRQLSRTTLLLYIFGYKFASVPLAISSIYELSGAIVALAGVGGAVGLYAYKKNAAAKAASVGADLIDAIKSKVASADTEE